MAQEGLFDREFFKKLDRLVLATRMATGGWAGGIRKSRQKGSSVEFSDFREYVHGDDFRRIDWNAYARFERLFIKLFMEERETLVTIFIDCSKSMDWGEPNKGMLARRLAGVFTYLALSNLDRVSLVAFNQKVRKHLDGISGKGGLFRALEFIESVTFEGQTSLCTSVSGYPLSTSRGGISIILTDLFSGDGYRDALKYLLYKKQEITLIHILAPQELEVPWSGGVRLVDSESGKTVDLALTPKVVRSYKVALKNFMDECSKFCYDRGIYYVPVSTALGLERVVFDTLFRLGVVR